jgi:hypothetical protein
MAVPEAMIWAIDVTEVMCNNFSTNHISATMELYDNFIQNHLLSEKWTDNHESVILLYSPSSAPY